MTDVILKGIGHEAIEHPNPGFTHNLGVIVAEQLVHQIVEIAIMGKHHVSTDVVSETGIVSKAGGKPADEKVALVNCPVTITGFLQAICSAQPRRASAEDHNFPLQVSGMVIIRHWLPAYSRLIGIQNLAIAAGSRRLVVESIGWTQRRYRGNVRGCR